MGAVSTVKAKELKRLKSGVALSMLEYSVMNETQAVEAWAKVPELAKAFEDMAYGSILKRMKESLDKEKFSLFLKRINQWDNNLDIPKRHVNYLVEFAGYKEKGGVIETASHYKEVKKIAKKVDKEVDEVYEEFEEKPKTAKEIRDRTRHIWEEAKANTQRLKDEFLGLHPEYKVNIYEFKDIKIEYPTAKAWKQFMSKVSHCVHPDKGGSDEMQGIINNINAHFRDKIKRAESIEEEGIANRAFSEWRDKQAE